MTTQLLEHPALASRVGGSDASGTEAEWADIVDALTRREFLAGSAALGAVGLGLAAFGTSDDAADAAPKTRVVDSAHGKVVVPADAKRIASPDSYVDHTLWDLGVTSEVGCAYYVGGSPRYARRYAALPKTTNASGVDLEAIAKLHPDLIISLQYPYIDAVYAKLQAIAPTVVIPFGTWQHNAAAVAGVVGRAAALTALKNQYNQRCQQIRATYAGVLARYRFDVLQGGPDQGSFWLDGQKGVVIPLLADAGLRLASGTEQTAAGYRAVSYEDIDVVADAGGIVYWSNYGSDTPAQLGPRLFAQRLWKDLPAVKAGRLVPVADFAVGGYGDALAALSELEAGLKKIKEGTR